MLRWRELKCPSGTQQWVWIVLLKQPQISEALSICYIFERFAEFTGDGGIFGMIGTLINRPCWSATSPRAWVTSWFERQSEDLAFVLRLQGWL